MDPARSSRRDDEQAPWLLSLGPLGLAGTGTGEGTTVLGAIRGRPLGVARALLWHLDVNDDDADDDANLLPDSASSTIAAGGRSLLQVGQGRALLAWRAAFLRSAPVPRVALRIFKESQRVERVFLLSKFAHQITDLAGRRTEREDSKQGEVARRVGRERRRLPEEAEGPCERSRRSCPGRDGAISRGRRLEENPGRENKRTERQKNE